MHACLIVILVEQTVIAHEQLLVVAFLRLKQLELGLHLLDELQAAVQVLAALLQLRDAPLELGLRFPLDALLGFSQEILQVGVLLLLLLRLVESEVRS